MTDFTALHAELRDFYWNRLEPLARAAQEKCAAECEKRISDTLSAYEQKGMQYEIIASLCDPVIFKNTDFCFETASQLVPLSPQLPGQWTYRRGLNRYRELGAAFNDELNRCGGDVPLYSYCGLYGDESYHFAFNVRPVLEGGVKSLYEKAGSLLTEDCAREQRLYLENTCRGLLALKTMAASFAVKARALAETADAAEKTRLARLAGMMDRTPWEAPRTFFEALNVIAFLQRAVPTLEGSVLDTQGRLDALLQPFYERDAAAGNLTYDEALRLVSEFVIIWDDHIDHAKPFVEHLGVTLTLGGCDREGRPVFNDVTRLFLEAGRDHKTVYPEYKCRYSSESPKDYLALVNADVARGKTAILYQNDEAMLPALAKAGVSVEDARDYSILGCWEPVIPGATNEHCAYVNLLRIFEAALYDDFNRPGLSPRLAPLESARDFESLYAVVVANMRETLTSRCRIASAMRAHWHEIDPHMILSAPLEDCLENKRDVTAGGSRYRFDELICSGLPNVVDSLLAIDELCFVKKKYSLSEFLAVVRGNWTDESVRREALACPFYGDEGEKSAALAARLSGDLFAIAETLPEAFGGKAVVGFMLFREMTRWCRGLRATPDGRHTGDVFVRGLTPSDLHHVESTLSAFNALSAVDTSFSPANSVLNLTVPYANLSMDVWDALIRGTASSHVQALQINCVSREELEDARVHPEKHQDIVVRVCGYSARFTSLSEEEQIEFIHRNFFEK